ncbi:MAG: DUF4199 domain-containing protein, partial [Gemmatimonadaceae bacterium]|nr:DUF4199 domain-containing protein [Chitinophagaceae bacterium]
SMDKEYSDTGMILGYLTMIIALSMIFFAIKNYRNKQLGGTITFGRAFLVGLYISLIASVIYAAGWELYLKTTGTNFIEQYSKCQIDNLKAKGGSPEAMKAMNENIEMMKNIYKYPILRFGITILEIFPVGLLVSLIAAFILKRKQPKIA